MIAPFEPNLAAQNYFYQNTKKVHPRVPFTIHEDNILRNLVHKYGTSNWNAISREMPGRNPRQCKDRWLNYLSPDIVNGPWSVEEEQELINKYEMYGPSWKLISTFFPTRTDINIKSRWNLIKRRDQKQKLQLTKKILTKKIDKFQPKKLSKNNINTFSSLDNNSLKKIESLQDQNILYNNQPNSVFHGKNEDLQINKSLIKSDQFQHKDNREINSYPLPFFSESDDTKNNECLEFQMILDELLDSTLNSYGDFNMINEESQINDGYLDFVF